AAVRDAAQRERQQQCGDSHGSGLLGSAVTARWEATGVIILEIRPAINVRAGSRERPVFANTGRSRDPARRSGATRLGEAVRPGSEKRWRCYASNFSITRPSRKS